MNGPTAGYRAVVLLVIPALTEVTTQLTHVITSRSTNTYVDGNNVLHYDDPIAYDPYDSFSHREFLQGIIYARNVTAGPQQLPWSFDVRCADRNPTVCTARRFANTAPRTHISYARASNTASLRRARVRKLARLARL